MSLLNNHKKNDKKDGKAAAKTVAGASKSTAKPGKGAGFNKKPVKTGGTRGS